MHHLEIQRNDNFEGLFEENEISQLDGGKREKKSFCLLRVWSQEAAASHTQQKSRDKRWQSSDFLLSDGI